MRYVRSSGQFSIKFFFLIKFFIFHFVQKINSLWENWEKVFAFIIMSYFALNANKAARLQIIFPVRLRVPGSVVALQSFPESPRPME